GGQVYAYCQDHLPTTASTGPPMSPQGDFQSPTAGEAPQASGYALSADYGSLGGGYGGSYAGGQINPNEHYVRGYMRNGKWVQPHWQTNTNHTTLDNFSHRGNINPHTGRVGHSR